MRFLKSQLSMEYIIIVGVILVITIPIFYYVTTETTSQIKLNKADDAVNSIARAADSVYSLGDGAKNYVWVTIPSGVAATSIGNKTVEIKLNIFGGVSDIYAETKANLIGSLPSSKGTYKILIESVNNGRHVAVTSYNDSLAPEVISTLPYGLQRTNYTTLIAITDENSACKYDLADIDYSLMGNSFSGNTFTHQKTLGELSEEDYVYYVRCQDSAGNTMESSAKINFTINLSSDITPPFVTNTSVDDGSVLIDEYVCINTTVEDNSSIDWVKIMLTSPLGEPFITIHNYSASDTGPSCSGTSDDGIYGVDAQMQAVGTWYVNTSYASDSEGNVGEETPHPDIMINVSEGIFGDFLYKPVTSAFYYRDTNPFEPDSILSNDKDITDDVADDIHSTPSQSLGFGAQTSLFVFELAENKDSYSNITIMIKVHEQTSEIPFNFTMYGYASDGDSIDMSTATNFSFINKYEKGVSRGKNEFFITDIVKNADYNNIKIRLIPLAEMGSESARITEVDFGML